MVTFPLHSREDALSFAGSTIGHIRIEDRIGIGGMGEVYRGFHEKLERRVAVKTIRAEHRLSDEVKGRFLREARLLSKLGHPGICQVYDLIESPEADFLVLEYVEGRTLKELEPRGMSFASKLELGEKIATALAAAHRERIVHRDLKADNVMVTPGGEVKVLDFGIARSVAESGSRQMPIQDSSAERVRRPPEGTDLTQHGALIGTARAMSPEQARGGRVTIASDLYSLGILLQELFTGEPAYEAKHPVAVLDQVMRAETRPFTGLDPDLTRLVEELQSLDPRRRPSAEATAQRLRRILDRPQRLRRRRLLAGSAVAAFAVLVALLALASWQALESRRARREADLRRKQAEDLIGFMIGDLRPKLESVGRLDLLDAVGDRALAYFDDLPESAMTGEELSRRIEAILQIGQVRWQQGRLPEALTAFERARELAARQSEHDPHDLETGRWLAALQQARSWIGQVEYDQGRRREALAQWRGTLDLARSWLDRHPGHRDTELWLDNLAVAQHNVGTALEASGDLAGALRSYRESLAIHRRLSERDPGNRDRQAALAATLAWVSTTLEKQGDLTGALAERQAHLEIQKRLSELEPGSPVLRQDHAVAQGFLAGLLAVMGERGEARDLYEDGLKVVMGLAGDDPENANLRRWLAAFHSNLGVLAQDDGDAAQAREHLRTARAIFGKLVDQDPMNPDWRLQLATCLRRTSESLAATDPDAARAASLEGIETLRPLLAGAADEALRGELAAAEVALGDAEAALGHPREARAAWERALAALEPCRKPLTFWKLLDPRARALLSLDRRDEARPEVERLRRMGYQGRQLQKLCESKGLG
jgi:serine/threonine-protein kinase